MQMRARRSNPPLTPALPVSSPLTNAPSRTESYLDSRVPSPPSAPLASTARSRAPLACGLPATSSWRAPSTRQRQPPSLHNSLWASPSDASCRALLPNGSQARTRSALARRSSPSASSRSWCLTDLLPPVSPFCLWVLGVLPSTPASLRLRPSALANARPRGWSACKWHARMRAPCSCRPSLGSSPVRVERCSFPI